MYGRRLVMLVDRDDVRRSILEKIQKTDFIVLREAAGEVPSSWADRGYSSQSWKDYRAQLRALLGGLENSEEEFINPDLLNWPITPNYPNINKDKSAQEIQDHKARMLEEYDIVLTGPVYGDN